MGKNKRSNYLIDKSFQLGFILRFMLIIIVSIAIVFFATVLYYYIVSNVGEFKLNTSLTYSRRGYIEHQGNQVYNYDKEQIEVYEKSESGNKVYICYNNKQNSNYKVGDIVPDVIESSLEKKIGPVTRTTTRFRIIFYPLLFTGLVSIILISLYSLFFSHRMAGPIYRMRVSLDRLLSGDYDFVIKVRKNDFFINIVERLEKLRQHIISIKKK